MIYRKAMAPWTPLGLGPLDPWLAAFKHEARRIHGQSELRLVPSGRSHYMATRASLLTSNSLDQGGKGALRHSWAPYTPCPMATLPPTTSNSMFGAPLTSRPLSCLCTRWKILGSAPAGRQSPNPRGRGARGLRSGKLQL